MPNQPLPPFLETSTRELINVNHVMRFRVYQDMVGKWVTDAQLVNGDWVMVTDHAGSEYDAYEWINKYMYRPDMEVDE